MLGRETVFGGPVSTGTVQNSSDSRYLFPAIYNVIARGLQVKLLKHLQHENVVGLRDVMRPAESEIATFPVCACLCFMR